MSKHVTLTQAKATLSECVRKVENGETLVLTRHGRAVAALVSAQDLEQFERLRKAGPEGGLASLAGGWEGSEELVQRINVSVRSSPRKSVRLDEE